MKPSFRIALLLVFVPAMLLVGCGDSALEPDTTAPLAPVLKGAISAGDVATVWWDSNTEPDLSGYYVYVTENGTTRQINAKPTVNNVATVDVSDGNAGVFVTAIDFSGNESSPSNTRLVRQSITTGRDRQLEDNIQ
jgi:hypothetical protein